jgi:hypothetical protein
VPDTNGRLSELSGVYDGAVPGAGFRKVFSLSSELNTAEIQQARAAYGSLLGDGNLLGELEEAYIQGEVIEEIKTAIKARRRSVEKNALRVDSDENK